MTAPSNASLTRPRRKRWLPYLAILVVAGLLALGLRSKPAQVETARTAFGPLRSTVSEEGKTRIRQRYILSSPVAGQLRRIEFKPGAEVSAGTTLIALIDPLPASPLDPRSRAVSLTRRASASSLLEKSRQAYLLAKTDLERVRQLFASRTVSPQDLDSAQLRETLASRDLASAEGSLKQAEAELSEFLPSSNPTPSIPVEVLAHVSGRILHVFQESARAVAQGTPLVEIGDPTDLEVIVELLSRDGASIAPGARVLLEQWGGAKPLEGRVRLVEPAAYTKISALGVEEQRVNAVVDLLTPPSERPSLGDNYRVEARVVIWESDRVLKAPSSALFRHGDDWAAYTTKEGRAVLTPIQVGRTSSGLETQILHGLQENTELILYPGDRITDGQRVSPIKVR